MKIRLILLTVAALSVAGGAMAQRQSKVDGNKLLSLCTGPTGKTGCEAYLSGVSDAAGELGTGKVCIPPAVTTAQMRDVVVKYLKDHPGDREMKAGTLTLRAFSSAFACKA